MSGGITVRFPSYVEKVVSQKEIEKVVANDKHIFISGPGLSSRRCAEKIVFVKHTRSDGTTFEGDVEVLTHGYGRERMISVMHLLEIIFEKALAVQFYYAAKPHMEGGYVELTGWDRRDYYMSVSFTRLLQAVNFSADDTREYLREYEHFRDAGGMSKAAMTLDDEEALVHTKERLGYIRDTIMELRVSTHEKHPSIENVVVDQLNDLLREMKNLSQNDIEEYSNNKSDSSKRQRSAGILVSSMPSFCNAVRSLPGLDTIINGVASLPLAEQPISIPYTSSQDLCDDN